MNRVTQAADGRPATGADAPVAAPVANGQEQTASSISAAELQAALGGRDVIARENLVAYFGPMLVAFAEGRGAVDVDDAVSGVLLAMFRGPNNWPTDEVGLRSALLTALRHRLMAEDAGTSDRPNASAGPDSILRTLDPDQVDLVLLRTVCGLDLTQVGIVLDRPVHSVKSLQRLTVSALGHAIGDAANEPIAP